MVQESRTNLLSFDLWNWNRKDLDLETNLWSLSLSLLLLNLLTFIFHCYLALRLVRKICLLIAFLRESLLVRHKSFFCLELTLLLLAHRSYLHLKADSDPISGWQQKADLRFSSPTLWYSCYQSELLLIPQTACLPRNPCTTPDIPPSGSSNTQIHFSPTCQP